MQWLPISASDQMFTRSRRQAAQCVSRKRFANALSGDVNRATWTMMTKETVDGSGVLRLTLSTDTTNVFSSGRCD